MALDDDVEDPVGVAADVEDAVGVRGALEEGDGGDDGHAIQPAAAPTVNMAAMAKSSTGRLDTSCVRSPRGGVGPPVKHGRHLHD